jgi:hypothetical protein
MSRSYLEITYRKGRPLAAYYYLPRRPDDMSVRTERFGALLVDFAIDDRPIGIEIPSPTQFELSALNAALARLGQPPAPAEDLAPLVAA